MALLFERLYADLPAPPGNAGYYIDPETSGADALNPQAAGAFLAWRWVMPVGERSPSLHTQMSEQPTFDALHEPTSPSDDDFSRFIELDGFLIDQWAAAAVCGGPDEPATA